MYVEAICPLCFASHIVPIEARGEKHRCEECEEVFIVNKKAKKTDKRPPKPRTAKAADEDDDLPEAAAAAEVLPEAKLVEKPKRRPSSDEAEEIHEVADAVQTESRPAKSAAPAAKRKPSRDEDEDSRPTKRRGRDEDDDRPTKRRGRDDDDDDRPRKRRREDDEDDRPRRRTPPRRSGPGAGLIVGLLVGFVFLFGLVGVVAWWALSSDDDKPQAQGPGANPPVKNGIDRPAQKDKPKVDPPKKDPPKVPPKQDPPKQDPPKQDPPKELPKPDAPVVWEVRADPAAAAAKLPADFTREIKAPGAFAKVVFPTAAGSPFVAVGQNNGPADERQIWDLQANKMTGKLVGAHPSAGEPVLSPDGAYLALLPSGKPGTVDVWALKPGKVVGVDLGRGTFSVDLLDFVGSGKLVTGRRRGATLRYQVWDAATGQRDHEVTIPRVLGWGRDATALSPGGAQLAMVLNDTLWVYELTTGKVLGQRPLPGGDFRTRVASNGCRSLTFSADGGELAALFNTGGGQTRLVCWDVANGGVAFDATFPGLTLRVGMDVAYKGHVMDWVGDRRGWLLYGQMFIDRKAALVGPQPKGLTDPNYPTRHMVGPDHVASFPGGLGGDRVLTVGKFDPGQMK